MSTKMFVSVGRVTHTHTHTHTHKQYLEMF